MNMKKTIAAVAACAVAVSAVATTVASAAEEVSVTYNLTRNVKAVSKGSVTFTATVDYREDISAGDYVQFVFYDAHKSSDAELDVANAKYTITGYNIVDSVKGDTFSYVDLAEGTHTWEAKRSSQVKMMWGAADGWTGGLYLTIPVADSTGIQSGDGFRATISVTVPHTGTSWQGGDLAAVIKYGVGSALADTIVADKNVDGYTEDEDGNASLKLSEVVDPSDTVDGTYIAYDIDGDGSFSASEKKTVTEIYAVDDLISQATNSATLFNTLDNWSSSSRTVDSKYPMTTTANTNVSAATVVNDATYLTNGYVLQSAYNTSADLNTAGALAQETAGNFVGSYGNILWYLSNDESLTDNGAYVNAVPVINDIIANYDETTFVFHTAAEAVKNGKYSSDADADKQYTSFGQHLYNFYGDELTGYTYSSSYDWSGYNLFSGALIVNGQLSMSLNDASAFEFGATTLSFNYNDALDGASVNSYATYLSKLQLATSTTWYWDSLDVVGANTEAEDAGTDAGVEADDDVIDDAEDEDVVDDEDVVEDDADVEDEDVDDDVDVDVEDTEDVDVDVDVDTDTTETVETATTTNPGTGNAPIALAVIPVALAAAAVVAKKRG
jgi:hypothetical protein